MSELNSHHHNNGTNELLKRTRKPPSNNPVTAHESNPQQHRHNHVISANTNRNGSENSTSVSKIKVISDLEGYPIDKLKNGEELIICGDITDTTFAPPNIDFDIIKNNKCNNLKNIWDINNNNKISIIFGNRDINKIKCIYVNRLDNDTSYSIEKNNLIDQFNNGNIILSFENFSTINNGGIKWKCNMKNWYPFWLDDKGKEDFKNSNNKSSAEAFKERFDLIFKTTMGAAMLLNSIPYELNINSNNNEYNAFIVFAIYNSMLSKPDTRSNNSNMNLLLRNINPLVNINNSNNSNNINSNIVKGWLYKMFTDRKNSFCFTKTIDNKLVLFSHGGITKKLIDNCNDEINNILVRLFEDIGTVNYNHIREQAGGLYVVDSILQTYNNEGIKSKVEFINNILCTHLQRCLNEDRTECVPSNDMLFLLCMSADYTFNAGETSTMLSPIMPGIFNIRDKNEYFYSVDSTVVQIFGHKPCGFATTVDLYTNNTNICYLLDIDTSNTFLGTTANNNLESKVWVEIKNNKITVHGDLRFNFDSSKIETFDYKKISSYTTSNWDLSITNEKHLITSHNTNINNINIECDIEDPKFLKYLKIIENKNINFHGITDTNIIFTINTTFATTSRAFNKTLFILSIDEFIIMSIITSYLNNLNLFIERNGTHLLKMILDVVLNPTGKISLDKHGLQLGGVYKLNNNQLGGDGPDDTYYSKYMKYKQKYIELKK